MEALRETQPFLSSNKTKVMKTDNLDPNLAQMHFVRPSQVAARAWFECSAVHVLRLFIIWNEGPHMFHLYWALPTMKLFTRVAGIVTYSS